MSTVARRARLPSPYFSKHLRARNRLHLAGTNLIPAPDRFGSPKKLDLVGLSKIEALYNSLRKKSSQEGG